jgi:hypothetical protein
MVLANRLNPLIVKIDLGRERPRRAGEKYGELMQPNSVESGYEEQSSLRDVPGISVVTKTRAKITG